MVISFALNNLVSFKIDAEKDYGVELVKKYNVSAYPTIIFLDDKGGEIDRIVGYLPPDKFLKELNADIALVVAYGQILSSEILSLTKKGFINIHASLLPKWRGAAPIQRSIMNLDKQTGISIMKLEEKLDTGPICNSYSLNILENENSESLSERLSICFGVASTSTDVPLSFILEPSVVSRYTLSKPHGCIQ